MSLFGTELLTDPWTLIPLAIGIVSYILRAIPPFKHIWWIYKWFFIALFIALAADRVKDEVKDWWNK